MLHGRGGKTSWHFRPMPAAMQSPAVRLDATIAEAKRLMASLTACLNEIGKLATEAATAPPAIVEPRTDGYQTATMPAGEVAVAG